MFQPLDDVLATLDALANTDFASEPPAAVASSVEQWCQAVSRLDAVGAPLLAAWDAQQGWAEDGSVNGTQWLRSFGELPLPGRRLKVARRLRAHAPLTAAALAVGELSYEKVSILMDALRDGLGDTYTECEQILVDAAKKVSVSETRTLARHWRSAALDTLGVEDRALHQREGRYLKLWETLDGQIALEGVLDPEAGAVFKALLAAREQLLLRADVAEARVARGEAPPADDEQVESEPGLARSAGQRRADALTDLIGLGADRPVDSQRVGGPSSELHLSTTPEALIEAAAARIRNADLVVPGLTPSGVDPIFDLPPLVQSLLERPSARCERQEAVQRAVDRALDPDTDSHLDDHDHPVDPTLVDLLACDCTLTRVLLDALGIPLDVGRSQRLATREQRRALRNRDGGCAFPGCERPPSWCDAHHIIPWILDGPTDIDNLVLLCRRHHHLMHQKVPWVVHIDPATRRPVFTRPDGQPARQTGHRPPARATGPEPPDRQPGHHPPDLTRVA